MRKLYYRLFFGLLTMLCSYISIAQISLSATAGTTTGTYTTLKGAFDAINLGLHQGAITITINANTTEAASAVLNATGGAVSYTSVVLKPAASTSPTISGSVATALISLNGATNVTIDGSNTVGGTSKNLTISNTSTASGATIMFSNGASNNTVKNSVIQGVTTGTDAVLVMGTSTAAAGNNTNTIQNNDITKGATNPRACIYNSGTTGKPNTGNTYRGNRIFDFAVIGFQDGDGTATGFSNNTVIDGNEFYLTSAQNASLRGILLISTSINNVTISKNYFHDLNSSSTSTTGLVAAIQLYDANIVTVVNNMIALSGSSSISQVNGILQETAAAAGQAIKIYYNTVSISGTTSGVNESYAFQKDYSSAGDEIRDNILVNTRVTSGTGGQYAIANNSSGTTAGTIVSNYNDLVSTGNAKNFVGGTALADYATLANWQTGATQDANSISINPVFVSATNLHLTTANALIDNKGTPITGITTDYDNDTRSATTPDLGMDEFTAAAAVANDIQATAFISPLSGGTVATNVAFTPQASFTNNGTATQTNVTVRYRIINSSSTTVYNQTATIATIAPGQVLTVSFPSATLTASGAYTLQLNAELVGDQTTSNDQIGGTLTVSSSVCGTIHVGAAQPAPYNTLTAAINQLKNVGVNCAVTLLLDDANYSTAETFPIVITAIPGASSANTITIKPNTGVSPTITGAAATTIQLLGADYIKIDGSNTAGGTTKNLTIGNTATASGVIVWIASASTTDGATNNVVKNTILAGSGGGTVGGILTGSGTTLGGDAEAANSNDTITNNTIIRVQNGLYLRGPVAAANYDAGWVVTNNILGSTTVADKLSFRGLLIGQAQNFTISGNTVMGVVSSTTSTSSTVGIQVATTVAGGNIFNNKVSDVKQTNTTGVGAYGILLGSAGATSAVNVYNNFVWDVAGAGNATTTASNGHGILITSGGGYNVYYNTVNMSTPQTTGTTSALHVTTGVTGAGAIDLRNNILVNQGTTATSYAINSAAANTVFSSINYNDYAVATGGTLGFIGSNRTTLADIQTGFGGNVNSLNIMPVFVSASDLHLATSNSSLDNKGIVIATYTTDIDGQTRSTTTPDLGADEFTATTCTPPTITTQPASVTACTGNVTFTVAASGTGLTYQWTFNTTPIPTAVGTSLTVPVTTPAVGGNYAVIVTGTCGTITSNTAVLTYQNCTAVPDVNADITSVVMTPTIVRDVANVRVTATKSMKLAWTIVDAQGKVVMTVNSQVVPGKNDIALYVGQLSNGTYQLKGASNKGVTGVVRFVKM